MSISHWGIFENDQEIDWTVEGPKWREAAYHMERLYYRWVDRCMLMLDGARA